MLHHRKRVFKSIRWSLPQSFRQTLGPEVEVKDTSNLGMNDGDVVEDRARQNGSNQGNCISNVWGEPRVGAIDKKQYAINGWDSVMDRMDNTRYVHVIVFDPTPVRHAWGVKDTDFDAVRAEKGVQESLIRPANLVGGDCLLVAFRAQATEGVGNKI